MHAYEGRQRASSNRVTPTTDTVAQCIRQNIETIAKLEAEFNRRRTWSDRVADIISDFTGSMSFVGVHALLIGGWILLNLHPMLGIRPWDPFPFMLLAAMVSTEAIFLSTFVLIKQSRMSRRADDRAHLDLQINLLAEREMTLVLQMLQAVCTRLNVQAPNEQVNELKAETPVEAVANELQKAIGTEEKPISS
jgi:uncharacterized membrane protein